MAVHACTIIARNSLPQARVLGDSFRQNHPEGTLTALVIDDLAGLLEPAGEPFDLLFLEDIGHEATALLRMAAQYDRHQFAAAVKPWLVQHLLERGSSSVIYLDPDVLVLLPLDELAVSAASSDIVLTPRLDAPLPRDELAPSELSVLATGVYDVGVIGIGPACLRPSDNRPPFLDFWKNRVRRDCVDDIAGMRFRDQRWFDLVPAVYQALILHDTGCPLAYWNLYGRTVTAHEGRYEVDGRPLRLFHFSGFDPDRSYVLTSETGHHPRTLLSEQPVVRQLVSDYADRLAAHGHGRIPAEPWSFDTMANGVTIDRYVRHIYGDALRAADRGTDEYPPVPWDWDGADALCAWLVAAPRQEGDPGQLSVYLASVFGLNQESLRPRFFDPQFADRPGFMAWARGEASEGRLVSRLVTDPLPAAVTSTRAPAKWGGGEHLRSGMVVAGYFRAEVGVGQGARLLLSSLEAAAIPHAAFVFTETSSRQDHRFEPTTESSGDFDIAVVCVNADHMARFARSVGPEFFDGRHVIGQWAWEVEEFPDRWPEALAAVDEIWAVSEFTRRAIAQATDKPVFAVPHAIEPPEFPAGVGRRELGIPLRSFVFLFCLDLLSILERKNPLGLIEAYRSAFATDDGATLVVKVINGDQDVVGMERIRLAAMERTDIMILADYLSHGEVGALMHAADCYVSLHRSEGFGLTMGEAMALGKPVIATGYSGNLDFMDDDTAYLVPWTPGSVPEGCDPYPVGARWADPDLEEAARLMRRVFEHPEEARALGARARASVATRHSPTARARFLQERFAAIEEARARPDPLVPSSPLLRVRGALVRALGSERVHRYRRGIARRLGLPPID